MAGMCIVVFLRKAKKHDLFVVARNADFNISICGNAAVCYLLYDKQSSLEK